MRLRRLARRTVEAPGALLRRHRLRRLVKRFRAGRADPQDERWLSSLRSAWGNPSAADVGFLRALVISAGSGSRSVLECGSGLTTLLLSLLAEKAPFVHVALEDSPRWAAATRRELARLRLSADVRTAPLQDFGTFDWYDVSALGDNTFDLVVCDGPRAAVARGGRVGVLAIATPNLSPTVDVLLDDSTRSSEQEVLAAWRRGFSVRAYEEYAEPSGKSYARLRIDLTRP